MPDGRDRYREVGQCSGILIGSQRRDTKTLGRLSVLIQRETMLPYSRYPGSMCAIEILSTLPTPQSIRYFSTTEIVGSGSVSLMNASFVLEMTTAVVPLPTFPVPFPEME
jgi:hypothetical protein